MRTIKFRALKDDMSPVWIYGNLLYIGDIPRIQQDNSKSLFTTCLKGTEGQYTGLKDKNGTEVYEGDLLRFPAKDKWEENNYSAFEVFLHDGNEAHGTGIGYRMCRMHNHGAIAGGVVHTFHPKNTERMEVIGNIYEHKNLLNENNNT